ncbi:MFS transporter [Paenibacillus odorifer]|uniref:MFS transporter n=1 Tax=Paenibacillus TaxID=44249 RepID=UPI00096EBAF3|nr:MULTISPECIES: MFS transporter [Paenibacillus]MDH6428273.1 fucose permease [Paenibacillus sp. PastH-4]MDH6444095.1 fucose permease [Paenibacillus sp. PastF-4]MDH6527998.1 fucose permease [Paenibacillus sp. PastH-3]OMD67646.1 MFS transporter [Paenibacillus odorifer]
MATFFLIIIYLAFISLGLPDSLLGSAWPVMRIDLNASLGTAGILSMVIAVGTIVSSLMSGVILKRFGTGKVTLISCIMTAVALLGFAGSPSLVWLIIAAIPLGLGAGSVDAGLNSYVATHYKAHHMSWLHCFWGVGATLGPIIMGSFISEEGLWRQGYLTVAYIQLSLVIILFVTLPLWDRVAGSNNHPNAESDPEFNHPELEHAAENTKPWKLRGVKLAMLTFLFYSAIETSMGLWGSSFLVNIKDIPASTAATWVSFFYLGITFGRMVTGFITFKMSNKQLIRYGQLIALIGTVLLVLPLPTIVSLVGFMIIGLGLAPIFPCMLHETPVRFGKKHAQSIMGFQMATAYTGTTLMPPFIGLLASKFTLGIFPAMIVFFAIVMLLCTEKLNQYSAKVNVG